MQIIPQNQPDFDGRDYLFTTAPKASKQARETGKFCKTHDRWYDSGYNPSFTLNATVNGWLEAYRFILELRGKVCGEFDSSTIEVISGIRDYGDGTTQDVAGTTYTAGFGDWFCFENFHGRVKPKPNEYGGFFGKIEGSVEQISWADPEPRFKFEGEYCKATTADNWQETLCSGDGFLVLGHECSYGNSGSV